MKIAIVCPDGRSLVLFCKGIIRAFKNVKDAEVYILCSKDEYIAELEELGVRHLPIDLYRFFSPMKDLKLLIQLCRIFSRERFELVYNISTKPNIYGAFAARLAKVDKLILHVVGLGSGFLLTNGFKDTAVRFIFLKLYHMVLKMSDKVWFFNENDYRFFVSNRMVDRSKCLLTKSFLDTQYYSRQSVDNEALLQVRNEFRLAESDKLILMIARLIWSKGIREFIEAADILKDRHPRIKFLLIAPRETGHSDEVPASFIDSRNLPNLIWVEYRNDLRPYYAACDMKVLPSFYKEGGHPRSLLEAMAMGKPIITTDNMDCSDVVESGMNGVLVPVKDAAALAAAIEDLVEDDDKRRRFGLYSRRKIESEFDENAIIEAAFCQLDIGANP